MKVYTNPEVFLKIPQKSFACVGIGFFRSVFLCKIGQFFKKKHWIIHNKFRDCKIFFWVAKTKKKEKKRLDPNKQKSVFFASLIDKRSKHYIHPVDDRSM